MKIIVFLFSIGIVLQTWAQSTIDENSAVVLSEFIYQKDDVGFPSCHASTIEQTKKGLVAAWFGGTAEKNPDVGIWVSRLENGKWTKPVEVANGIQHKNLRYPTWNPVLFNAENELLLFYKDGPNPKDWWGEIIRSQDMGKSWSESVRLPEQIWGPIKNKPVVLSDGTLLCPSSTEHEGWKVHMEFTRDNGKTWERTEALNNGEKFGAIQPTILFHKNNKLQTLCRSTNGFILSAWSENNGKSWTEFENLALPNPNSGIDAVTLKDGRHVLVYNHISSEKRWGRRNSLHLAVSADGINWEAAIILENDKQNDGEYSYPAVIQSLDGLIHITYTWNRKLIKHVVVDPAKISAKPITNGVWPN